MARGLQECGGHSGAAVTEQEGPQASDDGHLLRQAHQNLHCVRQLPVQWLCMVISRTECLLWLDLTQLTHRTVAWPTCSIGCTVAACVCNSDLSHLLASRHSRAIFSMLFAELTLSQPGVFVILSTGIITIGTGCLAYQRYKERGSPWVIFSLSQV